MKALMVFGMLLLLTVGMVSAANDDLFRQRAMEENQEGMNDIDANRTMMQVRDRAEQPELAMNMEQLREQAQERAENGPAGLSRAIILVSNEEARERLEANLERYTAMHGLACEGDCAVSLTDLGQNRTRVRAQEKVRFLGLFPVEATEEVDIADGTPLGNAKKNIWRRMVEFGLAG